MSSCKIKRDLESCEREIEKLQKTIKQKNKELQEVKAYIEKLSPKVKTDNQTQTDEDNDPQRLLYEAINKDNLIEELSGTKAQLEKELRTAEEELKTSSANPSTPNGQAFITKHRMELVNRLGLLPPILTRLHVRGVLSQEEIEIVEIKPTKSQQNQALLNMVVRKGARAQEYFYLALRESDLLLVEDLCNS
uniref:CARD domain-containing protein n=1 Tax=Salmo trutta TaxID=8032 RepID=A0A673Z786_SALTR